MGLDAGQRIDIVPPTREKNGFYIYETVRNVEYVKYIYDRKGRLVTLRVPGNIQAIAFHDTTPTIHNRIDVEPITLLEKLYIHLYEGEGLIMDANSPIILTISRLDVRQDHNVTIFYGNDGERGFDVTQFEGDPELDITTFNYDPRKDQCVQQNELEREIQRVNGIRDVYGLQPL